MPISITVCIAHRRSSFLRSIMASPMALLCTPCFVDDMRIFAAGSLRLALNEIIAAYQRDGRARFVPTFGPLGKLKASIEQGDVPDVFASSVCNLPMRPLLHRKRSLQF